MKTKIYITIFLALFGLTTVVAQTTSQQPDSLQYIQNLFGFKLENRTSENRSGIVIIKAGRIKKFNPFGSSPEGYVIVGAGVLNKSIGIKKKDFIGTENTSQFTKTLFELRKNNITDVAIVVKAKNKGYIVFQLDISAVDANTIFASYTKTTTETTTTIKDTVPDSFLIAESEQAGAVYAKNYYRKHRGWFFVGTGAGIATGIIGIVTMPLIASYVPVKKIPQPPPNVNADAWTVGYKKKAKGKKIVHALLGGVVGTSLAVVFYTFIQPK